MFTFNKLLVIGFAFTIFGLVSDLAHAAEPVRHGSTVKCTVIYINGDCVAVCAKPVVTKVQR